MALLTCPDCGNQVSDRASACPKCGSPVILAAQASAVPVTPQTASKSLWLPIVAAILVVLVIGAVVLVVLMSRGSALKPAGELTQANNSKPNPPSNSRGISSSGPQVVPTAGPGTTKVSPTETLSNQEKLEIERVAKNNSVKVCTSQAEGSGIVVKRFGDKCVIITNCHVIEDEIGRSGGGITVYGPHSSTAIAAYPIWFKRDINTSLDLAYLVAFDINKSLGQEVEMAPTVTAGEFVIAVGSPGEDVFHSGPGNVQKIETKSDGQLIYHSATTEHGSSGGGLFNKKGQFIGLNTYLQGTTQSIATRPRLLLESSRIRHFTVQANKKGWQSAGIVVPRKSSIRILACGEWHMGTFAGSCTAGGMAGYEEYSVTKAASHGALLFRIGTKGNVSAVDMVWKVIEKAKARSASAEDVPESAELQFQVNDTSVNDNARSLDVTVLIME